MHKKPARLSQMLKNKLVLAFVVCGILLNSSPHCLVMAEEALDETLPIELTPSAESMDLSSSDTISMSFDGALLKDVLLLFSQQSGLNFVASQEAEAKKVTVYFENVSPKDALDSIITANGLTYSKKPGSDIYVVSAASKSQAAPLVTKVIRLKFMRLSSSPLDVGGQATISSLSESSSASSSGSSSGGGGSSSSSSDRGADKIAQKMLSAAGKLTTDLHTNSLIVTDTKENVEAIETVLSDLDVPSSQVLLEVYIMEVSKTVARNIGIDWGGTDGALGTVSGGVRTTTFPFNQNIFQTRKGFKSGELGDGEIALNNTESGQQMQYGLVNASNFSATLHYIENDSKTKILARPKVLTQNNEAAEIKLVANAAIGIVTTTTDTAGSANSAEEAERADIGVTMRITPQINSDDTVLLFLEPSVSTAQASRFFPESFVDPTTRLIRTMARVRDNQTLAIGGLIDSQEETQVKKMPILGDIPFFGKAFKYDSSEDTERELIIFVTPHIARGSSSLGSRSATAQGEDLSVKRVLNEFMDEEMDKFASDFENFQANKDNFFTKNQEFIRASERKSANPAIEQQMNYALDSLSPQIVDQKINQAMDSLSAKKGT